MRHAVLIALACATVLGCARTAPSLSAGKRHPWTIPHVLRIAEMAEPHNLNPYSPDAESDLGSLVYSYLVVDDARGRLVGDLARDVPSLANGGISRDGRTYVYHLRRNVIWHDGVPFTARDVIESFRAVMNSHSDAFGRQAFDWVVSIEAADPTTVIVHLRERYAPFVARFFTSVQDDEKPVLPAHILAHTDFNGGRLSSRPIGTGPFRLVTWVRGDRIILRRFDRYFKGSPKLATIEIHIIPAAQTVGVELAAHKIDLVDWTQAALLDRYRSVDGIVVETAPLNSYELLLINAQKPALRDIAVRRAIAAAVPYDTILHDVEHNITVAVRNILPATALGYEALPQRTYDPATADTLLDRAGWRRGADGIRLRNGVRLNLTLAAIAGATSGEQVAVLLQSSLKAIGVDLAIKSYSLAEYYALSGPLYGGSFDLALTYSGINWDPDLYDSLACDRWYPRGENLGRFCDPRVDALERAGLQTDDPSQRAAIYRKASRLIWSDVPFVPLYGGRNLIVRSADLRNYQYTPSGGWNPWQSDI
jgi:peptide/nickel transport system substrate-binding protein